MKSKLPIALAAVVQLALVAVSTGDERPRSHLWGELTPGAYAAGYKTIFAADRSRTWSNADHIPRRQAEIDRRGRPIRISMWYPAVAAGRHLRIVDYIQRPASAEFGDAERALESRDRAVVSEWAPADANAALLEAETDAYSDAPPAPGRFPLILYAAGVNPYTLSNVVLAEYLATHGFVTIAVPSLGPAPSRAEQHYNTFELLDSARDLEFAWSMVRDAPNVAANKLAAVGHSLGGTIALLVALHNSNVSAVVGLDGTYGFAGSQGANAFTAMYDPSRVALRAALLDIRRADADTDLRSLRAFHDADRYFVTMRGMSHGDFTSFVMGAHAFNLGPPPNPPANWTREIGFAGYQRVCSAIRDFFRGIFDGDGRAFAQWQTSFSSAGDSITHEAASVRF